MMFGSKEWKVPKNPSATNRREKDRTYDGFPVDIAVFESAKHIEDYKHLLFIIECKRQNEASGLEQLDIYWDWSPTQSLAYGQIAPIFLLRLSFASKMSKIAFTRKSVSYPIYQLQIVKSTMTIVL